jgi:hypothetical protein
MLGPTIYIPSGLAKLLIPLTSSRQMPPVLADRLGAVVENRSGAADRVHVGPKAPWQSGRSLICCAASLS